MLQLGLGDFDRDDDTLAGIRKQSLPVKHKPLRIGRCHMPDAVQPYTNRDAICADRNVAALIPPVDPCPHA